MDFMNLTHQVHTAKRKVEEYDREARSNHPAEVKAAWETLRAYHQTLLDALLVNVKAELVASVG